MAARHEQNDSQTLQIRYRHLFITKAHLPFSEPVHGPLSLQPCWPARFYELERDVYQDLFQTETQVWLLEFPQAGARNKL